MHWHRSLRCVFPLSDTKDDDLIFDQTFFYKELKKAQAVVPEPAQPKIKLKVGQTTDSTPTPKKITIHVGGRGGSADSPAPPATKNAEGSVNGQTNGATGTSTPAQPSVETAANATGAAQSPTSSVPPGLKAEESSVASPAGVPRPPSVSSGQATPGAVKPPIPVIPPQPFQHNPLVNGYMEQKRLRGKDKGMCLVKMHWVLWTNISRRCSRCFDFSSQAMAATYNDTRPICPNYNRAT